MLRPTNTQLKFESFCAQVFLFLLGGEQRVRLCSEFAKSILWCLPSMFPLRRLDFDDDWAGVFGISEDLRLPLLEVSHCRKGRPTSGSPPEAKMAANGRRADERYGIRHARFGSAAEHRRDDLNV